MRRLLIVYSSATGGTRQLVEAAARGAATETAIATTVLTAPLAGPDDLLAADGFLFAAPENLAALSGLMKDFFDRTYYPVLDRLAGRPYAAIICAGSDGAGAARQLARIATGWRLKQVADPLIILTHAQTPEAILAKKTIAPAALTASQTLGATLAAGLAMGVF